MKAWLSDNSL